MKYLLYLSILFASIQGCSTQKSILETGKPYEIFRGFEPTDPTEYAETVPIVIDGKIVFKEIKLLSTEQMLSFLNNETVLVSIGQFTAEGGISYSPITISSKGSSYKITMDYMKSATLPVKDSLNENIIGLRRVGVGLRLISLITAFEAGINIGDLSSIGIAAKTGKASGTLMVEVIGIKSKDVTTLIPLPSEINQTTIQNAMQALATIKSKIYDLETKLYPQVMAINDYFKTKLNKVTTTSEGSKTGNTDNNNKIQLQFGKSKYENASLLEKQAFANLFDKEIDFAIKSFEDCAREYPNYHSVSEIASYLKSMRNNLVDKNSESWEIVYKTISTKYSWKLSSDIMDKLNERSK